MIHHTFELRRLFFTLPLVLVLSASCAMAADAKEFGSTEYTSEALIGILYDFKQTQQLKKVEMAIPLFYRSIETFIDKKYDESVLSGFFRAPQALYATEIFISHRSAETGPKAFGVEKIVKPTFWVAHYKGQVIPPVAGSYEFVASADGFVAIAVNGKTLLVKHAQNDVKLLRQVGGKIAGQAANGKLRHSLVFESDGKTPLDLDILLAEAGGEFNAFLLYRRLGESYALDAKGNEILPVFQLAKHEVARLGPAAMPEFAAAKEYWRAVP